MTRLSLLLSLALAMAGCIKEMPNKEIIAETKLCEDAGMTAHLICTPFEPAFIRCEPKQK